MAELKTKQTENSVEDFLNTIEDARKREDCFELVKMMEQATGQKAKMWGGSIIGCGSYHYKYDSGHEGDSCKSGFSPRKQSIAMYIAPGWQHDADLLQKLGKHKTSGSCLHIAKLADVDKAVLKKMISKSYKVMTEKYG